MLKSIAARLIATSRYATRHGATLAHPSIPYLLPEVLALGRRLKPTHQVNCPYTEMQTRQMTDVLLFLQEYSFVLLFLQVVAYRSF